MEYRKLALAGSLATVLAACGGSDSTETPTQEPTPTPPPAPSPTLSGKVADGYLVGAKVCLDLNENKTCDDGEPSATSEAGGDFELEATQEQIDTYPLLVEVTADVVDEDTGETVSSPYSLTAPVGYEFVSPLTTLVQSQIDLGNTSEEAEALIQELLDTTQALSEDFIAAQANSELTEEQQTEFAQMHQVAQVTARVMANNLAAVQEAADAANISADDLLTLIVDTVVDSLETIVEEVEAAGDDFDPDAVAESETVADSTGVDGDTLEDQVDVMNAQANAAAANLVAEVSDTGIFWFDGDYDTDGLYLDYGSIMYDADTTTTTEVEYSLMDGEFVESTNTYKDLVLGEEGWQLVNDQFEITTLGEDGTITLTNKDFPGDSEVLSAEEIALEGLNTKLFLQDQDNTWVWHKVIPEAQTFAEGAKAFEIEATTVNDLYSLYYWDDCQEDEMVEGLCNSVWSRTADSEDGPAITLASLISATASDGSIENLVGPYVAWDGQDNILAELVEGGVVNYYLVKWREDSTGQYVQSAQAYGTGTWRQETVSGVTLALMALPDDVIEFGNRDDDGEYLLSEYQGAVRQGDFVPAGTSFDDEVIFNVTAKNDIIDNVDLSLLNPGTEQPALSACTTGDSDWDDENDRPDLSTLKSLTEFRSLTSDCRGDNTAVFTEEGVTGSQYKIYEPDGTLETLVEFDAEGVGSFTDYNEDGTEDVTESFTWSMTDQDEVVLEVTDENDTVALRFYMGLVEMSGDYVSVKTYMEEADWAEMDGTGGEVLGEVWKKVTVNN
ncbi:hypothetical protein L2750_22365 [Shewanella submarina]|uniref:Acid phosphatase n=1 Tax=Shewanella submarina TaxID=2016376 RepID=A0ABV7GJH9_9GAMM|nr:hypothetical protein [Shewanella submarina]MCL1039851.1 hypothetical protein [Shewanella submarina]